MGKKVQGDGRSCLEDYRGKPIRLQTLKRPGPKKNGRQENARFLEEKKDLIAEIAPKLLKKRWR